MDAKLIHSTLYLHLRLFHAPKCKFLLPSKNYKNMKRFSVVRLWCRRLTTHALNCVKCIKNKSFFYFGAFAGSGNGKSKSKFLTFDTIMLRACTISTPVFISCKKHDDKMCWTKLYIYVYLFMIFGPALHIMWMMFPNTFENQYFIIVQIQV